MSSELEAFIPNRVIYELLPRYNHTDKKSILNLCTWTDYTNLAGHVPIMTLARGIKDSGETGVGLSYRGMKFSLQRIRNKYTVEGWYDNGSSDGIFFRLSPLFSINVRAAYTPSQGVVRSDSAAPPLSQQHFDSKESKEFPSFSHRKRTDLRKEKDRPRKEKDRPRKEKDRPRKEKDRPTDYRPDNWVQIPKEIIRGSLSGNSLHIYALMLTRNTHPWTLTELREYTGICKYSIHRAIDWLTMMDLIIEEDDAYKIKDPKLKEYPSDKPAAPPTKQLPCVYQCGRPRIENDGNKGVTCGQH